MIKNTRYILAQALIEVDVSEQPYFDESKALTYFNSALRLPNNDATREVKVFLLASKPGAKADVVVEEYAYRDFKIQILQDADSVGSGRPTYFALAWNIQAKYGSASPIGSDMDESIKETKEKAEMYVDKRKASMEKAAMKKAKSTSGTS